MHRLKWVQDWLESNALITGIGIILLISRRPDALFHPQFWAEDVLFYMFAHTAALPLLLLPQAGYLHFLPRITAWAAQYFPLSWAPLLFNLVALAVQGTIVYFLVSDRLATAIPNRSARILMAFLYIGMPNSWEIEVNLTNAQWNLALLMLLVVLSDPPSKARGKWVDRIILCFGAGTGPFSIFLFPVALLKTILTRRQRFASIALGVGAAMQTIALLTNTRRPIILQANPDTLLRILGGQYTIGSLLGRRGYEWASVQPGYTIPVAALLSLLLIVCLAYDVWRGHRALKLTILHGVIYLASCLAAVNWISLGDAAATDTVYFSGRYMAIPTMVVQSSVLWLMSRTNPRWIRVTGGMLTGLMLVGVALNWEIPPLIDYDWQNCADRYEQLKPGAMIECPTNPAGWHFSLTKYR